MLSNSTIDAIQQSSLNNEFALFNTNTQGWIESLWYILITGQVLLISANYESATETTSGL
jgi:hypothetical protein